MKLKEELLQKMESCDRSQESDREHFSVLILGEIATRLLDYVWTDYRLTSNPIDSLAIKKVTINIG